MSGRLLFSSSKKTRTMAIALTMLLWEPLQLLARNVTLMRALETEALFSVSMLTLTAIGLFVEGRLYKILIETRESLYSDASSAG